MVPSFESSARFRDAIFARRNSPRAGAGNVGAEKQPQLVGAMLSLQARRFPDAAVREELGNAVARTTTWRWSTIGFQVFTSSVMREEAGPHLQDLCEMLRSLSPAGLR